MKLPKERRQPQKGDKNGVTSLICLFHNSAYNQSGLKKLNVIYANDLNANLF